MRGAGRSRNHRAGIQYDLFAVRAVATLWDHHGHDGVPDLHTGGNSVAYLIDDPGRVHSRHVRRRVDLLLLCTGTVPSQCVGRVHRRRVHPDTHLTRSGMGLWKIDDLQSIRTSVNHDSYCAHVVCLSSYGSEPS